MSLQSAAGKVLDNIINFVHSCTNDYYRAMRRLPVVWKQNGKKQYDSFNIVEDKDLAIKLMGARATSSYYQVMILVDENGDHYILSNKPRKKDSMEDLAILMSEIVLRHYLLGLLDKPIKIADQELSDRSTSQLLTKHTLIRALEWRLQEKYFVEEDNSLMTYKRGLMVRLDKVRNDIWTS